MEQEQKGLKAGWRIGLMILTALGLLLTINQIFALKIFNFMPLDNSFYTI